VDVLAVGLDTGDARLDELDVPGGGSLAERKDEILGVLAEGDIDGVGLEEEVVVVRDESDADRAPRRMRR